MVRAARALDGRLRDLPLSPDQLARLKNSVDHANRKLATFRNNRTELLRRIVGRWYGDNGSKFTVPLPLMRLAWNVLTRLVVANNPRVNVTSQIPSWRGKASDLKLAMNQWVLPKIRFRDTLRELFGDALLCGGFAKVGVSRGDQFDYEGKKYTTGVPFFDRIDIDDYVQEWNAKDRRHCAYYGNYYEVPLDWVKSNKHFSKTARDAAGPGRTNLSRLGEEEARDISRGDSAGDDDFEEMCRLVDLYLPRYGVVLTFHDDDGSWAEPLDVVKWTGPAGGPYKTLALDTVPNNAMPLGPLMTLRDTEDAANRLARKLIRQGERQKDIVGVQGGASEDGERILKAMDGEMIRIDNPAAARQFSYGGPNQTVSAMMILMQDLFDRYGGNLSALGGLSPQAGTLGQDEMLTGSASKQIDDYRGCVVEFVKDVCYDLAWHVWHDPFMELPLSRSIQLRRAPAVEMPFNWGPLQRNGDFLRFNLNIEPYSMMYQSPQQKAQALMGDLTQLAIPLAPLLQGQGGQIDIQRVFEILGDYQDLPELSECVAFGQPSGNAAGNQREMGDEIPMKAPVTSRTYTRVNRPGATIQGKDAAMAKMLMGGGGASGSQAASLMRSAG